MNRQDFRLRAVLNARQRALDAAQGRLANEFREKEREQREQKHLLTRLHRTSDDLHARLANGTSAGILRSVAGAMDASHAGAIRAGLRADARDAAISDARRAITQARQALRSLEILEAKWREKLRLKQAKRDQKRLDEIATQPRGMLFS